MRLYIVRHADPDYVNDSITAKGRLEAEALAARFSAQGLDRIYCSPQGRAIATMNYTRELLKTGFEIEEWTREVWPELYVKDGESKYKAMFQLPGEAFRSGSSLPTHDT
jgi:probable phosphoglycerate mutase